MIRNTAWRTAALAAVLGTSTVAGTGSDLVVSSFGAPGEEAGVSHAGVIGPDVITGQIRNTITFGSEDPSGTGDRISAFAVGGDTCNIGDEGLDTLAYANRHPALHQSVYRLKNGRFGEIGLSWVKHTFYTNSMGGCGTPCNEPSDGSILNPGCSDSRNAIENGAQTFIGPMSEVNAFTGEFPWPAVPAEPTIISYRLQVHEFDLDPTLNEGASYFVQVQHLHFADAAAGNAHNNASYREVHVSQPSQGHYYLTLDSAAQTQVMQAAIRAWKDTDPSVQETDVQVPGEGLFILAAKVTDLGTGYFHYEYALQNLNSDRSGGSFTVPLPDGVIIENVGFHDVDYHDGEPWDGTDWPATLDAGKITWATTPYGVNTNANALRWSTLYNFRFDANVAPDDATIRIGLFKPGDPSEVTISTVGPSLALVDCNHNGTADPCDVDCDGLGCRPPCGGSLDCDNNRVPDECQTDCNHNGIPDTCDIASGFSQDCDSDAVPDECEPDCDGDGIPDACETLADTDGDGVPDCSDLCLTTTPPGACLCPPFGRCCWSSGICIEEYPRASCIAQGGTPGCMEVPCRQGCLLGDFDDDGDLDLRDLGGLMDCFSGANGSPGFVAPSAECLLRLDFNNDGDVDLADYAELFDVYAGP